MLTALFVIVILGVTTKAASKAQAAIGIGLMLTLIHLISIPITNTSVNPARSLGPALFEGGTALNQLWLFIVAPIAGGIVGARGLEARHRRRRGADRRGRGRGRRAGLTPVGRPCAPTPNI